MCKNEPLAATKEGWKKFKKISWKFATIRMGVETTPLVIRGLLITVTIVSTSTHFDA
jgi:hypothetical protein